MRRASIRWMLACAACIGFLSGAGAQDRPPQPSPAQRPAAPPFGRPGQEPIEPGLPTVALQPLIDKVAQESHKQFLVDGRVRPEVYLGGARAQDVTYPLLLSILRINNLAAVDVEGRTNIIPEAQIRFYPTPIVNRDDKSIAADEFVTRLLTLTNVSAGSLVPILRPLLPVSAHMAALPPSDLILMDRYANVQRITALVRQMDRPGAGVIGKQDGN